MSERKTVTVSVVRIALCWIALVAAMMCGWLFEYLRLGGVTVPEVSHQTFTWFMPADYAFGIWNAIYAALLIWLIVETPRVAGDRTLDGRQTALFVTACALIVGWLVAFHFQQVGIALVEALALWLAVGLLYISLRDDATRTRFNLAPFSLLFSWASVAVASNATHLATRLGAISGVANQGVTIALVVAMLMVAALSIRNSRDYVFPLAILWAMIAVGVNVMAVDVMLATVMLVVTTAAGMAMYLPTLLSANVSPARRSTRSERLRQNSTKA